MKVEADHGYVSYEVSHTVNEIFRVVYSLCDQHSGMHAIYLLVFVVMDAQATFSESDESINWAVIILPPLFPD